MADRRKSVFDRRKSTFDSANEKPESATERGSIWIPSNPTAKHDDPFGKRFKMTRSDNLFVQMGTRFEELTVKRIYIEDSISFLAPYKELQDNRRSIYYGQPKMLLLILLARDGEYCLVLVMNASVHIYFVMPLKYGFFS